MATYLDDLEATIGAEIEALQSQLDGEGAGEKHGPERIGKKPGETQPSSYARIGKKGDVEVRREVALCEWCGEEPYPG